MDFSQPWGYSCAVPAKVLTKLKHCPVTKVNTVSKITTTCLLKVVNQRQTMNFKAVSISK